ncbi:MAG: 4-(cytidine 5'-diphospho)-2-C-methyl-D-erythritol kinase [Halothermotrichaceae bacterium]
MSEEIIVTAPAKINLALDIIGLRADGYHQLEMIMQSISLHDKIKIKKEKSNIKLKCSDPELPEDKSNLAYQAAELILNRGDIQEGVCIYIDKRIPVAAGLAGGSSDAAAVLTGINKLYKLNLDNDELYKLATEIGSDVPFCLEGGTALATGRGDQLKQLSDLKKYYMIIVTPPVSVSTRYIYQQYDQLKIESNISVSRLAKLIENEKNINWDEGWANVLEKITSKLVKDIKIIKKKLKKMGAKFTLMSGSGPSVFAITDGYEQAFKIKEKWDRTDDFIDIAWNIKRNLQTCEESINIH